MLLFYNERMIIMGKRPFSDVKTEHIPEDILDNLERLGFKCKGDYGSFYKKEKGFTYRIATHKETSPDQNVVLTILYEKVEELRKIKVSKFRKLVEKYKKKQSKAKDKLLKKIKSRGGKVYG